MRELIHSGDRAAEVMELFRKPQWYLEGRNYHVRTRVRIVSEMLGDSRFEQVLDVGCGDGSISLPLLSLGASLTLVDVSEEMLGIARSRVPARCEAQVKILKGNCLELDLEPRGYDLIVCLGVLAYVDSAAPLIGRLATLLRPGGRLLLECTDSAHWVSLALRGYGRLAQLRTAPKIRTAAHSQADILGVCRKEGLQLAGSD